MGPQDELGTVMTAREHGPKHILQILEGMLRGVESLVVWDHTVAQASACSGERVPTLLRESRIRGASSKEGSSLYPISALCVQDTSTLLLASWAADAEPGALEAQAVSTNSLFWRGRGGAHLLVIRTHFWLCIQGTQAGHVQDKHHPLYTIAPAHPLILKKGDPTALLIFHLPPPRDTPKGNRIQI